jgi:pyridoxamine 5'-phosphate oxidase
VIADARGASKPPPVDAAQTHSGADAINCASRAADAVRCATPASASRSLLPDPPMNAVSRLEFSSPSAGYDQPLEMWIDCHKRIARMNALLQRLVDHLKHHAVDKHAGVTATSIRRYFDEAAPRHHEDEEVDLFPRLLERLRAQGNAEATQAITQAIDTLLADHAEMHDLYQVVRAQLQQVEAGRDPHFDDTQIMLFVTRYRAHIEVEESVIAPALKRALKAKDLKDIGRAMAARRGVDWDAIVASTKK